MLALPPWNVGTLLVVGAVFGAVTMPVLYGVYFSALFIGGSVLCGARAIVEKLDTIRTELRRPS